MDGLCIRFLVYCKCECDSGIVGGIPERETGAQRVRRDGIWCLLHGKLVFPLGSLKA